jgi:tetraacyldisaccharide 4'-kinase
VALLWLPGLLYRVAVGVRNALYDRGWLVARALPCRVISIGNLTVGGTGKTPVTASLAMLLRDAGYRVGVVSRGYRRAGGPSPLVVSDGKAILADSAAAGDEPFLIARDNPSVPVAVGADRVDAARRLLGLADLEVILLDDAFQHRRIARDIDLLLVDGRDPWGDGRMLPRGPLREPLSGVTRADAFLVTRSEGRVPVALADAMRRHNPDAAVIHCRLTPRGFARLDGDSIGPRALRGFAAFAFCGIARPERFEDDLKECGVRLLGSRRFPDHHRFTRRDLEEIAGAARACRAELLVTTEKDMVRIATPPDAGLPLYALALGVDSPGPQGLGPWVLDRLEALRRGGPAAGTGASRRRSAGRP